MAPPLVWRRWIGRHLLKWALWVGGEGGCAVLVDDVEINYVRDLLWGGGGGCSCAWICIMEKWVGVLEC